MTQYNGPLNTYGIRSYNEPGRGETLSDLLSVSSAVVIPPNSSTVITCGQTGHDEKLELPSNIKDEIFTAFRNVEAALAAAGVKDGFRAVYKMTSYHTHDLNSDESMEAIGAACEKYFKGNRPAWAAIGVANLFRGAHIEIVSEAILREVHSDSKLEASL